MTWLVPLQDRAQTPYIGRQVNPIEVIVYHNTVTPPGRGPQGSDRARMIRWLSGRSARSSTHFVILRDGTLLQGAPLTQRTWHAGKGTWQGRSGVNSFSIGLDYENTGVGEPFTVAQMATTRRLVARLVQMYPQLRERHRHVGHSQITPRKIDPGPEYDWSHVERTISARQAVGATGGGGGVWKIAAGLGVAAVAGWWYVNRQKQQRAALMQRRIAHTRRMIAARERAAQATEEDYRTAA